MTPPQRHVCLVSNQPLPTLMPLLDPAMGARHAVLVHAEERAAHAEWLAVALKERGIETDIVPLRNGYDLDLTMQDLAALRDRLGGPCAVNVTGGTKMMSIAAWECFNRPDDHLYYVDINTDAVQWLRPRGLPGWEIGGHLTIETCIQAHGLKLNPKTPPRREVQTAPIMRVAHKLLHNLALLDAMTRFKGICLSGAELEYQLKPQDARKLRPLLNLLAANGMVEWKPQENQVRIVSNEFRNDLTGGWLEMAVFKIVHDLQKRDPKIQDVVGGLHYYMGSAIDNATDNEVDVVVLRGSALFLIECKTGGGRYQGDDAQDTIVYKLDAIRDAIGGIKGRAMIVHTRDVKPSVRLRAAREGITVVDRRDIKRLQDILPNWLNGSGNII